RLPPEDARALTLRLLAIQAQTKIGRRIFRMFGHGPPPPEIAVQAFGLTFPTPVGLAPGIDIDGTALAVMQHLGFGFVTGGPVGESALPRLPETDPLRILPAHAIVRSDAAGGPDAATVAARIAAAPELTIPIGLALRGDLLRALHGAGERASYHVLPP